MATTSSDRVLEALQAKPQSIAELALSLRCPIDTVRTRIVYLHQVGKVTFRGKKRQLRIWRVARTLVHRGEVTANRLEVALWKELATDRPATIAYLANKVQASLKGTSDTLHRMLLKDAAKNISTAKTRSAWIRGPNKPKTIKPLKRTYKNPGISTARESSRSDRINDLLQRLRQGPILIAHYVTDRASNIILRDLERNGWVEVHNGKILGYGITTHTTGPLSAAVAFESLKVMTGTDSMEFLANTRPKLFRRFQRSIPHNDNSPSVP